MPLTLVFNNGDLVEVETISVRALARVRESSPTGRLHIAFEMGEYLPWVDTDVQIRRVGSDPSLSSLCSTARILHAGSTTAMLQLVEPSAALTEGRAPYDTLPLLDQDPLEPKDPREPLSR